MKSSLSSNALPYKVQIYLRGPASSAFTTYVAEFIVPGYFLSLDFLGAFLSLDFFLCLVSLDLLERHFCAPSLSLLAELLSLLLYFGLFTALAISAAKFFSSLALCIVLICADSANVY